MHPLLAALRRRPGVWAGCAAAVLVVVVAAVLLAGRGGADQADGAPRPPWLTASPDASEGSAQQSGSGAAAAEPGDDAGDDASSPSAAPTGGGAATSSPSSGTLDRPAPDPSPAPTTASEPQPDASASAVHLADHLGPGTVAGRLTALPPTGSASGRLPDGFPQDVVEVVPSSQVVSAAVSSSDGRARVELSASTRLSADEVAQEYRAWFLGGGFVEEAAPSQPGSPALTFTRGDDQVSLSVTGPAAGSSDAATSYQVLAILGTGR